MNYLNLYAKGTMPLQTMSDVEASRKYMHSMSKALDGLGSLVDLGFSVDFIDGQWKEHLSTCTKESVLIDFPVKLISSRFDYSPQGKLEYIPLHSRDDIREPAMSSIGYLISCLSRNIAGDEVDKVFTKNNTVSTTANFLGHVSVGVGVALIEQKFNSDGTKVNIIDNILYQLSIRFLPAKADSYASPFAIELIDEIAKELNLEHAKNGFFTGFLRASFTAMAAVSETFAAIYKSKTENYLTCKLSRFSDHFKMDDPRLCAEVVMDNLDTSNVVEEFQGQCKSVD